MATQVVRNIFMLQLFIGIINTLKKIEGKLRRQTSQSKEKHEKTYKLFKSIYLKTFKTKNIDK
jgi:Trk-type K+ transport system membrane component